jgi:membrane-associated protein
VLSLADSPWVLVVILAVCICDAFFPPVPSESVVVAVAVLATAGDGPQWWTIALAAMVGAWLGDNLTYLLGRQIGTDRWAWLRRPRARRAVDLARRALARRGALFIMTARFVPVGRVAVNLTAGATGFHHRSFVALSALAAAVWAGYSVGIGALFGHVLGDQPLLATVIGIATAVSIGFIADLIASRALRKRGGPPAQVVTADLPANDGPH